MKYLWYGFLGLFSLGFLGAITALVVAVGVINHYGSDLPDYEQLKTYEPPIVSRLYAGDGRLMAEFAQEKRIFMPIEAIPDQVKNAFMSAEDKNFYNHPGLDYMALLRAVYVYAQHLAGMNVSIIGGSTITQQVVKNMLLTNERRFKRKIKEAILSYRLEKAMSKDRILELYLNEIFLGSRAYGIAAAALQYFNKSLDELTLAEVAYLAALPKAPNNYHPIRNREKSVDRRNWVIGRMLIDGHITEAEADLAKISPLETRARDNAKKVNAPFFAEEVRRVLIEKYGKESLYGGGLAVRSTIDPKMQTIARETLRDGLEAYDRRHGYRGALANFKNMDEWKSKLANFETPQAMPKDWSLAIVQSVNNEAARISFKDDSEGLVVLNDLKWARKYLDKGYALGPVIERASQVLSRGDVVMVENVKENNFALRQVPIVQGALIALDPHTGRILAMQGGWKYGTSEFNRATQAERQPGSAFKPFVYLAGLDNGFTPATLILDAPFVIEDRPGNFWSPTNYSNEYYGPTTMRVGVEKSRNLMTVRLADYLGMETISEYAEKFGITDNMPKLLANSLGASETTPLRLTAAYGMLVNGGKKITPTFIDRIQDRRGTTIFRHDERDCLSCGALVRWKQQETPAPPDNREQITDPRTAYQMVSILEGVVQRGTGVRIRSLDRPLAGKTGTTNESKDAWFVGFSPDLVVGVFVGFDDPRSLGKKETGSSVAVPIFKDFMGQALEDRPLTPFRVPSGIRNVQVNPENGTSASFDTKNPIWESFVTGTEPTDDVYILDSNGISIMNNYFEDDPYFDPYNPNQGDYYSEEEENEIFSLDNLLNRPPVVQNPNTTRGTGGIY
ncbi:MAG: penicillin-binding protein 1A [Bdellovibrionales bacterium]